jgi:hypothetical protein|tara:strand:+ start:138 stop:524 length:387 start_codon:yes stop_codon:yes gene_type:complete
MKESLEVFVLCKKCQHGARLYHHPGGGAIKSCKGAHAVPFVGPPDSTEFFGWVVAVCKYQQCKNFNKPVPLPEKDFRSLAPPCCRVCKKKMKPERLNQGKGNYSYRCENNDRHSHILLAECLPRWKEG